MFDIFKNRLEITGTLWTVTAIRISVGRSTEPIGSDLPVIKDALGHPLIPGSSFKGAWRSRLESFLRGIDLSLAEDPANFKSPTRAHQIKTLKEQYKDDDFALTKIEGSSHIQKFNEVLKKHWQRWGEILGNLTLENRTYFTLDLQSDAILTATALVILNI